MARARALAFALAVVAAGCAADPHHQVTASTAGAYEPSLAVFPDGFAVAWYDTRDGHGEIYERALDASGAPAGPELRLTSGTDDAYEADIHPVETTGSFVVGWYEKATAGTVPHLGLWSRDGTPRWTRALAEHGRNTVVRVHGTAIFAAWIVDETSTRAGVWTGWWNTEGDPVAAARRIADAGRTTYNLNAALAPAGGAARPKALVVFDATAGTKAAEIFVTEDDGTGARTSQLTADDGFESKYPDLVLSGDRAALTWFDSKDGNQEVYLRVDALPSLIGRAGLTGTRVTATSGHSIGAYAAWNGTRLGLAWCDDTSGQHEIFFRDYDSSGTPLGAERRLTNTRDSSLIPSIRPWKTGFALAPASL